MGRAPGRRRLGRGRDRLWQEDVGVEDKDKWGGGSDNDVEGVEIVE